MKDEPKSLAMVPAHAGSEALSTGLSIFDNGTFESLYRVAGALAASSLVPKTLTEDKAGPYPPEKVAANCLRVVEQAARWGLSPFAVMDCASVVHGRLMWEGKLVAAVIDASLGIRLSYSYSGSGKDKKVVVSGKFPDESEPRTIEGTVGQWETKGTGSPWENPNNHERQLAYRGAREWARRHAPAVMLGVYSPDEFEAEEMRDVTPRRSRVEVREEPLDPQAEDSPGDSTPPDPNPSVTPASGRQKKDRHHRDCAFKDVTAKRSEGGKPFWVATFDIGQKAVELVTFSESLSESLIGLDPGTPVKITFTLGAKGDYQLEDFEVLEGGLI